MGIQRKELLYWLIFSVYGLLILSTLPYIVPMQRALGKNLQDKLILFIVVTIAGTFLILFGYIFFIKKERRLSKYLGILFGTALIGFTVYFLILRTDYALSSKAVEFIHFFEYGLLSYLAYLSLKFRITNRLVFVWGVLF